MPETFIQVPPDSTGKKVRHRTRTVGADLVHEQFVVPISPRIITGKVSVSSFRTLGNAAVTQNLFSIENGAASGVNLALHYLGVVMDATAALITVAPSFKMSRPAALPTVGTALGKVLGDTGGASAATVVARGATASDGGAATAITATAATAAWTRLGMRLHTAAGYVATPDIPLIPELGTDEPFTLLPGQALLIQIVAIAAANNPATNHYVCNAAWDEYTV